MRAPTQGCHTFQISNLILPFLWIIQIFLYFIRVKHKNSFKRRYFGYILPASSFLFLICIRATINTHALIKMASKVPRHLLEKFLSNKQREESARWGWDTWSSMEGPDLFTVFSAFLLVPHQLRFAKPIENQHWFVQSFRFNFVVSSFFQIDLLSVNRILTGCFFGLLLIQKWHPDRRGRVPWLVEEEAKRRFQLVQEAYESNN